MKLRSFSVKGFKNFEEELRLDDLGDINVIHGENNVGKSNLLQAIDLFCLGLETGEFTTGQSESSIVLSSPAQAYPRSDIFHRAKFPSPPSITLHGRFVHPGFKGMLLSAQQELRIGNRDRSDYRWSGRAYPLDAANLALVRHALIGIDRRRHGKQTAVAVDGHHEVMPASLCLQLYDAKLERDAEAHKSWALFAEAMQSFSDLLGEGKWDALYDRLQARAFLAYETPAARYPLDLLGSGVQQITALVANILLSNADIVSIEEPELNLRYSMQLRLAKVLRNIVGKPGGPSQIFLTSHSPAFEVDQSHFYWLRKTDKGPVVEKRPVSDARRVTEWNMDEPPPGKSAPLSYVTSDGLVEVPEDIRQMLGISNGGGVCFVQRKDSGHVEMLTNEQFIDLFEPRPEEKERT